MGAVTRVAIRLTPGLVGSLLIIALVTGAAGGLATGLVSGGTRARTAVDRLIAHTRLPDVMMFDPTLTEANVEQMRALPGVDGVAMISGYGLMLRDGPYLNIGADVDGRYGVDTDVRRIIRGRDADPDAADEVVLGEKVAEALGVDLGETLHFRSYSPEQLRAWGESGPSPAEAAVFEGPAIDLDVVGISRHPGDLTSDDPLSYFVALPPGFHAANAGRVAELFRFAMVDIGDSPTARRAGEVASEMARIGGADAVFEEAGEQSGGPLVATLDFVGKSMVALAAAIALAGLVVGGLMVARTVGRASMDTSPLVASGMTAGQRSAAIALAMAPCSIAAGVMALVVAVASSAVIPFGLARRADPDTGLRLDALSLTVGAMLTVGAVIVTVAVLAWRAVRREVTHRGRHNTVVARLAATGLPVGPLVGVDLAVGAGSKGPPAGNHFASVAVAMAVAAGVGALVLGASIDRLESTPSAFGWTWDFVVPDSDVGSLADDPDVESLAIVTSGTASIDGRQIVMRGVETVKGPPPILVLEGRLPGKGEVVLGKRTMADLDVDLGDSVHAEGSDGGVELRVVGQAVFAGILDVPEASWGAAVDASDLEALGAGEGNGAGAVIGLVDGADRDRFARRIESELDEEVATVEQPIELARLREIEAFPWILTSFLGAVGLLAVLNAVVTTARRRAGDLAVLRSLGLAPRGVFRAVTVQSGVLTGLGLAVGIPFGLVIGQQLWRAVAGSLGVVVSVAIPWYAIALVAVAGVAASTMFAIVPARAAARRPIADALRAE